MWGREKLTIGLMVVAAAASVQASETPSTVSPGELSEIVAVEGRCPTFSWAEVDRAAGYELAIHRVDEESGEVFRTRFEGRVDSFTPSLQTPVGKRPSLIPDSCQSSLSSPSM